MPNREPLAEDRNFIQTLKQARNPDGKLPGGDPVLDDLDMNEADYLKHDGFAALMCGDCDFSLDSIAHLQLCFDTGCIQLLSVNGGALMLDPESPPNRIGVNGAEFLRDQVYMTFMQKKFRHLFLDAHVPCGAATRHHMSAKDIVESLMRAKDFLIEGKDRPPRLDTIYLLLRYWDGGKLRTYGFKRRNMRWFLGRYRPLLADEIEVPI